MATVVEAANATIAQLQTQQRHATDHVALQCNVMCSVALLRLEL